MVSLEQRRTVTLTHLVSVKLFLHSIHIIRYTFLRFQRPLRLRQPVQHFLKGSVVIFPFFERAHWISDAAGLAYKGIRPVCFKCSLNLVKQRVTLSMRRPLKLRKHQVRWVWEFILHFLADRTSSYSTESRPVFLRRISTAEFLSRMTWK